MKNYRTTSPIVEAAHFTNDEKDRVFRWASDRQMNISPGFDKNGAPIIKIPTERGEFFAVLGDYIIYSGNNCVYPCCPDKFEKMYIELDL